jgi:hypothetical protein
VDDARRQQASKVILREQAHGKDELTKVILENGSDTAIFNVILSVFAKGKEITSNSIMVPAHAKTVVTSFPTLDVQEIHGMVSFTDASGRRWHRELNGSLQSFGERKPRKLGKIVTSNPEPSKWRLLLPSIPIKVLTQVRFMRWGILALTVCAVVLFVSRQYTN